MQPGPAPGRERRPSGSCDLDRRHLVAQLRRQPRVVGSRREVALLKRHALTALEHHRSVSRHHDVAGPQGQVRRNIDGGIAGAVAAVAAAALDQPLAIDEGVLQAGVAAAVGGRGGFDIAAGVDFRLRRRAQGVANLGRRRIRAARVPAERKIAAVAGAHAIGDLRAAVARRYRLTIEAGKIERVRGCRTWRRRCCGLLRRPAAAEEVQDRAEQPAAFRLRRRRKERGRE